jgi:hypothetical protein
MSEIKGFCSPLCVKQYKEQCKKISRVRCLNCKRHYSGSFLFCGEDCFQKYINGLKSGKKENKDISALIDKYPLIQPQEEETNNK